MYAKVFASLWQGTLYGKADVQLVFIYLLAHADADGNVRVVSDAIASATGIPLDRVRSAIIELEGRDPLSNTEIEDGARLERIGECERWHIVNYLKYRAMRDAVERRRQNREAQARHRSKPLSAEVSHGKPQSSQGEGEGEGEGKKPPCRWRDEFASVWAAFPHFGTRSRKAVALSAWMNLKPRPDPAAVLEGIQRGKESEDWSREGGRFVPGMQVWIRQRGWDASNGTPRTDPFAKFLEETANEA